MSAIQPTVAAEMLAFVRLAEKLGIELPEDTFVDHVDAENTQLLKRSELVDPNTGALKPEHVGVFRSCGAVEWALRHRNNNGLIRTGAVVEKARTQNGRQLRPALLINVEKWARWATTTPQN